ncbi:MAG TPA: hypothetical protein DDW54_01490, partial [Clostridiales bacterium]|nr:hypothetical protein [Clostridiales bacterium]
VGQTTPVTTDTEYIFTEAGSYDLQYTIYGKAYPEPLCYTTRFNVNLVEELPTVTVNGEYSEVYYAGATIPIFDSVAENQVKEFDVSITVLKDGARFDISGRSFVATEIGRYEIVYTATTDDGRVAEKRFVFTVIEDTEPPVIAVSGTYYETYEKGMVLNLFGAVVADNSDADISATIKVYLNGKEIEVKDGKITLDGEGTYRVVYSATDLSGLSVEKEYVFTVGDPTGEIKNKLNPWAIAGIATGSAVLLVVAAVAVVVIIKKKGRKAQ